MGGGGGGGGGVGTLRKAPPWFGEEAEEEVEVGGAAAAAAALPSPPSVFSLAIEIGLAFCFVVAWPPKPLFFPEEEEDDVEARAQTVLPPMLLRSDSPRDEEFADGVSDASVRSDFVGPRRTSPLMLAERPLMARWESAAAAACIENGARLLLLLLLLSENDEASAVREKRRKKSENNRRVDFFLLFRSQVDNLNLYTVFVFVLQPQPAVFLHRTKSKLV